MDRNGPAAATRRLRAAVRDLFDAYLAQREPAATSIEDINAVAASAPVSLRIGGPGHDLQAQTRWHTELGGNAALAAVATEAITLIGQPGRRDMLRRCANPNCSMLFLAQTTRPAVVHAEHLRQPHPGRPPLPTHPCPYQTRAVVRCRRRRSPPRDCAAAVTADGLSTS